jgi:hypothetical protein
MKKDFIGTVRFLYQVGGKTKSRQPALRSVRKICEENDGCIDLLLKGREDGRLAMYVTIESRRRFERKEECESWIQTVETRLTAELSPKGELSHRSNACITAWEKEMFGIAMGAMTEVHEELMEKEAKGPNAEGSEH